MIEGTKLVLYFNVQNMMKRVKIWDENDFDVMGWHDCRLYGISFDHKKYNLILDIDYIFKRTDLDMSVSANEFWIAPSYLIFENYHSIKVDFEFAGTSDVIIDEIVRGTPIPTPNNKLMECLYQVITNVGVIKLFATGYRLLVREDPVCVGLQDLNRDVVNIDV